MSAVKGVLSAHTDCCPLVQSSTVLLDYCTGADMCSCTIIHLPACFSKITVQRKVAISCFPAVVTASSLTVAGGPGQIAVGVDLGVVVQCQLEALVSFSTSVTPFWYSAQLLYFRGAMSKKL